MLWQCCSNVISDLTTQHCHNIASTLGISWDVILERFWPVSTYSVILCSLLKMPVKVPFSRPTALVQWISVRASENQWTTGPNVLWNIFSVSMTVDKIKTVTFAIISTSRGTKFYLSSTTFCMISLFVHVIYSSSGLHCSKYRLVEE